LRGFRCERVVESLSRSPRAASSQREVQSVARSMWTGAIQFGLVTIPVKGYQYAPDKYVVITDEDLEKLPLKTVRSIEIEQFVDATDAETNTKFVKQAYYLEPDRVGRKAFQLLKEVLQDKGLTAICKIVIRDREALAAMDPFENTMLLSTLYWPDEIRALGELDLPEEEPEIKPAE